MKGLCELCGKKLVDTKMYKFTDVDDRKKWKIDKAEKEKKKEIKEQLKANKQKEIKDIKNANLDLSPSDVSPKKTEEHKIVNEENKQIPDIEGNNIGNPKEPERNENNDHDDDDYIEVIDIDTTTKKKTPILNKRLIK
jgi:hypothetical protein